MGLLFYGIKKVHNASEIKLDPDKAPAVIKHNADALLDDRDKLIRWQRWYSASNKKAHEYPFF